jgi:hypothetical protein
MSDMKQSLSMARLSNLPSPSICSCPTNSDSVRGRIRHASGGDAAVPCIASEGGCLLNCLMFNE